RYVRRGRRHVGTEQFLQHPAPAEYGTSAVRVRGHGQDARLAQDAAAHRVLDGDAAHFLALDAVDLVELRQAFVDKGVVGVDDLQDTAVLADDRVEEQDRLLAHGRGQLVVEL